MPPRKTYDDPRARNAAVEFITDHATSAGDSAMVVDAFPVAEFETAQSRVGGEVLKLRRVVLTGPWEVVTDYPE